MEKQERIRKILGIALLFTMITSLFALLSKLCSYIIMPTMLFQNKLSEKTLYFFQQNVVWLVAAVCVIVILIVLNHKNNAGAHFSLLRSGVVRGAAGALIILDAIVSLSNLIMPTIRDLRTVYTALQNEAVMEQYGPTLLPRVIIADSLPLFLLLCQIFVGIYLLVLYKEKPGLTAAEEAGEFEDDKDGEDFGDLEDIEESELVMDLGGGQSPQQ